MFWTIIVEDKKHQAVLLELFWAEEMDEMYERFSSLMTKIS